jgi:hypothetical protein
MYSHQKKSAQPYSTLIHNMPHHEETFEGYEYPIMMRNTQQYSEIQFDTYKRLLQELMASNFSGQLPEDERPIKKVQLKYVVPLVPSYSNG